MRKIRINLYTKEFKPKKEILSFSQMIVIWAITLCVVVASCLVVASTKRNLTRTNEVLIQKVQDADNNLIELQRLLSATTLDKSLENKVEQLKLILKGKQELMSALTDKAEYKSRGYSGFMRSLALIKMNGLAINEFSISEGKAAIRGVAKSGKLVPLWLQEFDKYDDLRNRSFGSLSISKDSGEGFVNFSLLNPKDEEAPSKLKLE